MKRPKITDIRATTVTVPLEAPLRHSNGAHWGRFVRTIVEVETDVGIVGLGEMGGGGESGLPARGTRGAGRRAAGLVARGRPPALAPEVVRVPARDPWRLDEAVHQLHGARWTR